MLDQETIAKIQEAVKGLPPEKQEEKAKEMLAKINPEALKQLEQGSKQCPFCLMVEGKLQTVTVYEDDFCKAVLEINPANLGHVLLFTKTHLKDCSSLRNEQTEKIFVVANKISKSLLKIYPGTNILVCNGKESGQRIDHLLIHIIPRKNNDNVNFVWKSEKVENEDLEKIKLNILENMDIDTVIRDIEEGFDSEVVSPETRIP